MNALIRDFAPKFAVVAFPTNQFGLQEPGNNDEILNILKYVRPGNGFVPKFPITTKINVNGEKEVPLFTFIKSSCPGPADNLGDPGRLYWNPLRRSDISWNFEKILIDAAGRPRYRFEPSTDPDFIRRYIIKLLGEIMPKEI